MIVSWNWLTEYLRLDMPVERPDRTAGADGPEPRVDREVGGDLAIDLEVTSNRPDCLGHLGVAREIAVLFDKALCVPDPRPSTSGPPVETLTAVTVEDARPLPAVHGAGRLGRRRSARAPGGCASGWRRSASGRSATSST